MKKILGIIVLGLLWCNTAVALPKCIGEDINKWIMCEGTFTYADGRKYIGEWMQSQRHGQGTSIESNGKKNSGQFKNEKFIKQ